MIAITEQALIEHGYEKRNYWHKRIGRYNVTVWKAKSGVWVAELDCESHHTTLHNANFDYISQLTKY